MESIVRLASLTISNIKNVRNGQIIMPNTYRKHLSYRNAEVLGAVSYTHLFPLLLCCRKKLLP